MNYNLSNYLLEENLVKANEYLIESLGTVYHATSFKNLKSILKNDEIELTPNASKFELQTGNHGLYFLSTMRNKSGQFFQTNANQSYIVLDVDKLKTKMKSKSVSFFGPSSHRHRSEEEERFWSDKENIVNVEDVIKSIHLFVSDEKKKDVFIDKTIKELNYLASVKKIPVYIYDKFDNFRLGKNPTEFKDIEYVSDTKSHKEFERAHKEILSVIHLMKGERLTKEQLRYLELLVHRAYIDDFIRTVSSDVQFRRKHEDPDVKNLSIQFMNLMKEYRYKDIEKFLKEVVADKARKVLKKDG